MPQITHPPSCPYVSAFFPSLLPSSKDSHPHNSNPTSSPKTTYSQNATVQCTNSKHPLPKLSLSDLFLIRRSFPYFHRHQDTSKTHIPSRTRPKQESSKHLWPGFPPELSSRRNHSTHPNPIERKAIKAPLATSSTRALGPSKNFDTSNTNLSIVHRSTFSHILHHHHQAVEKIRLL
jgi:hypothetical protein